MAKLVHAQAYCAINDPIVYPSGVAIERTGVTAGDNGWAKYSGTTNFILINHNAEDTGEKEFAWYFGYDYSPGQPTNGQYEVVLEFELPLVLIGTKVLQLRRVNVSGQHKFRFYNVTDSVQIGSDSATYAIDTVRRFCIRVRSATDDLSLWVNGTLEINNAAAGFSMTSAFIAKSLNSGEASTGTVRYWSAWATFADITDTVDETSYAEMKLLVPDGEGGHDDYKDGVGGGAGTADWSRWDDWVSDGAHNGDTDYNEAPNAASQQQTSTTANRTFANMVEAGAVVLQLMRSNEATKFISHFSLLRHSGTTRLLSYGSQQLPTSYVSRNGLYNIVPGGGSWTQAVMDALEGGHGRNADEALLFVTACAIVGVTIGATNKAPPAPPAPPVVTDRRRVLSQVV